MLELINPIFATLGAGLGAGLKSIAIFKELRPLLAKNQEPEILTEGFKGKDKSQLELERVYRTLAAGRPRAEQLFNRERSGYLLQLLAILVPYVVLFWLWGSLVSSQKVFLATTKDVTLIYLAMGSMLGLSLARFFHPAIGRLRHKLDNEAKLLSPGIMSQFLSETSLLDRIADIYSSWMPFGGRRLTAIENDYLKSYLALEALVGSLEYQLLIKSLEVKREFVVEIYSEEITQLAAAVIKKAVDSGRLSEVETERGKQGSSPIEHNQEMLMKEFEMVGIQDFFQTAIVGNKFFAVNFKKLAAEEDLLRKYISEHVGSRN